MATITSRTKIKKIQAKREQLYAIVKISLGYWVFTNIGNKN